MYSNFTFNKKWNYLKGLWIAFLLVLIIIPENQFAQGTGKIMGRVIESTSKSSLPSANIRIEGTQIGTAADKEGRFVISGVPVGQYKIIASFLGYEKQIISVNVISAKSVTVEFELKESMQEMQEISVYGTLTRGQAKSLNEQKESVNIKNVVSSEQISKFPDRNAAEALQRIPSISITHDQGEGEMVQIRGIPQQYNSVTLNGVRIPAPTGAASDGAGRGVGLDLVSANMMEQIVVTKALTPEIDGDAIGGSIDFILKDAPEKPFYKFVLSGGLNQQKSEFNAWGRKDIQNYSAIYGQRFFDNKFGLLAAANYYVTNIGSILREYRFLNDQTTLLQYSKWTDYDVKRDRYGVNVATDYQFDQDNRLRLSFNYNGYVDQEVRRQNVNNIPTKSEERETRNRTEDQRLASVQLGGEHNIGNIKLDYTGFWIQSRERLPDRTYWTYNRTNPYTGWSNDQLMFITGLESYPGLAPAKVTRLRHDDFLTVDGDKGGKFNVQIPYTFLDKSNILKLGGKVTAKTRSMERHRANFSVLSGQTIPVVGGTFPYVNIKWNDPIVSTLPFKPAVEDPTYPANDYDATETIIAGFAMSNVKWTDQLSSLIGFRFENTNTGYTSYSKLNQESSYSDVLPSLHFTYRFTDNMNLRLALTTGLSRPNYTNLVPQFIVDDNAKTISKSNPELKPAHSKSVDLLFESYTNNLGLLSAGIFYKRIEDLLTSSTTSETYNADLYKVTQPMNGGNADVYGFEVAFNQRFSFIDIDFLKPFGIYFNFTYTHSKANFESREMPLTGNPKYITNLALFYDNPEIGLSVTVTTIARAPLLNSVGTNELNDFWFAEEFRLDISASQRIFSNLNFFVQLNNLTNQKEVERYGDPTKDFSRLEQTYEFGISGIAGFRFEL
ncbi:MAG: TonB-dependent receptor [Ignavibacteriales bacterium]|nr:TonB-dependent receptor [Ignavibacteriales bacterium]